MDDSLRGVVVHQKNQNETQALLFEDSTSDGVSSAASPLLVIPAECLEMMLTQHSPATDCTFVVKFADGRQKVFINNKIFISMFSQILLAVFILIFSGFDRG
jgi:hypothetical protein